MSYRPQSLVYKHSRPIQQTSCSRLCKLWTEQENSMDRSSKLINKNYSFISSSSTNIISYAGSQGRQLRIRTHGSISKKSLSCVWYISRMLQEMSAHNRRPRRHTAKTSPTVADGKARTVATGTAKTLFAVCQKSGTRQTFSPCVYINSRRKKAGRLRHGQLTASAAVRRVPAPWTHGEHPAFAVCPWFWHTAKYGQFAVCAA